MCTHNIYKFTGGAQIGGLVRHFSPEKEMLTSPYFL